jgi:hypothetical protein
MKATRLCLAAHFELLHAGYSSSQHSQYDCVIPSGALSQIPIFLLASAHKKLILGTKKLLPHEKST